MERKRSLQIRGVIGACCAMALATSLTAQPVSPSREAWLGKLVIPLHRNVQFQSDVGTSNPITEVVLRVEDVRDNQLRVRSLGHAGWMAMREAIPLDGAVDFYTARIKSNPADSDAFHRRGCAWFALEKYNLAVADYAEAIRLSPHSAALYNARAVAWCRTHEYDKALDDYAAAIVLEPQNALLHYNVGNVWSHKGNYEKALASYEQAIRLDPKLGWAYDARAMLLASCQEATLRNGREAVQLALTACQLHEWREEPQIETLAAAYAEVGDFQQAVKWQARALELVDPATKSACWSRLQLYNAGQPYRLR